MEAHALHWISCCFSLCLYRFLDPSIVTVLMPIQSGLGNRSAYSSLSETGVSVALRFSCPVSLGILSAVMRVFLYYQSCYLVHAPQFALQEQEESSLLN